MRYDKETGAIVLSVEELCERATRTGSIDSRAFPTSRRPHTAENARICRALKESMGTAYRTEVPLSHTLSHGGLLYRVTGQADGMFEDADGLVVDELKTGRGALDPLDRRQEARGICLAFFLCEERSLSEIRTRLVYPRPRESEMRYVVKHYTHEELRERYLSLIRRIEARAAFLAAHETEWRGTMAEASFPYAELRPGQHEMMSAAHRAFRRGERLFAQAPTGTGKTMSALYPALRTLGEGFADKVFYLTAKASTRREAYLGAGRLFAAGAKFRTIVLGAREQVCLCPAARAGGRKAGGYCNPIDCEYARGYYDRVEGALFEVLSAYNGYSIPFLAEVAKRYRLCPYELALDLSELCDVIVCDYNYAFDPRVYLRRYFEESEGERYLFLVDEAHNLADRARDMYSACLLRSDFERVGEQLAGCEPELWESLEQVLLLLRGMKRLCRETLIADGEGGYQGYYIGNAPLAALNEAVQGFKNRADLWLRHNEEHALYFSVYDLVASVRDYLEILAYYDDRFTTYVELTEKECSVRLLCLSPEAVLDAAMNRAVSTVFFSATLTPLDYFVDILGGGRRARSLTLPYPFDPANLCITSVDSISTRYEDRKKSYAAVAACLAAMVSGRRGNYIAYFPSYSYLEAVREVFARKYPQVEPICQERGMSYAARMAFIESFREDEGRLRLGFCVLGGSFSEGIDLPGSRLIGTAIVGVGLPGLSSERNIMRDYFENRCERGYDYAYTYPGMNHVLQAAGRVIRRPEDRGVVVLIDDRYATEAYRPLFPAHWEGMRYAGNASALAEIVRDFWKKQPPSQGSCGN